MAPACSFSIASRHNLDLLHLSRRTINVSEQEAHRTIIDSRSFIRGFPLGKSHPPRSTSNLQLSLVLSFVLRSWSLGRGPPLLVTAHCRELPRTNDRGAGFSASLFTLWLKRKPSSRVDISSRVQLRTMHRREHTGERPVSRPDDQA